MMITESRTFTLDVGQSLRLDCEFYMDNFDMFDNPVIWKKRQHGSTSVSSQINTMRNIHRPYVGTGRFDVALMSAAPRYRLQLGIASKSSGVCAFFFPEHYFPGHDSPGYYSPDTNVFFIGYFPPGTTPLLPLFLSYSRRPTSFLQMWHLIKSCKCKPKSSFSLNICACYSYRHFCTIFTSSDTNCDEHMQPRLRRMRLPELDVTVECWLLLLLLQQRDHVMNYGTLVYLLQAAVVYRGSILTLRNL